MSEAIDWTPPFVVLLAGLLAGALVIWLSRRRKPAPAQSVTASGVSEAQRDIETRLDDLIAQLRELDETASKRTPAQLAQERYVLELGAARVLREGDLLREREAQSSRRDSPAADAVPARAGGSTLRGFLWGVGSIAALGLLLTFASQSSRPREEAAASPAASGAADDAQVARLRAAVAAQPESDEARVSLARALLERNDMMGVFEETKAVLARTPDEPHALTYQAVVRLAMGQADQAEAMLRRAMGAEPNLVDAHIYLMLVLTETGRSAEADAVLAEAVRRVPDHREALTDLLARMRREVQERGGPQTAAGGEDPHAGLGEGPAMGGARAMGDGAQTGGGSPAAAMGAAPVRAAASISGVLDLDPSARAAAAHGAVVYVLLRPPGETGGPPLAVARMSATTFPAPFTIGAADSMTGGDVPDVVLLEARIDADGDAATRSPDDPIGRLDGVRLGTRDVRLLLAVKR